MEDHKPYTVARPKNIIGSVVMFDVRPMIYGNPHEEIHAEKCERCGEEVQSNLRYCAFCGHCLRECG